MTARFAYRRPKPPANALAAAKPARTPAAPPVSLPKGAPPAPKDAFKQVRVFCAGGAGRTTIAIPLGEYEHMLSFAGESETAVESACVAASKALTLTADGDQTWGETVSASAMDSLMNAFASRYKVKPKRKAN